MYICQECAKEWDLEFCKPLQVTAQSACELCGDLKNDWSYKTCAWTHQLKRYFKNYDSPDMNPLQQLYRLGKGP